MYYMLCFIEFYFFQNLIHSSSFCYYFHINYNDDRGSIANRNGSQLSQQSNRRVFDNFRSFCGHVVCSFQNHKGIHIINKIKVVTLILILMKRLKIL